MKINSLQYDCLNYYYIYHKEVAYQGLLDMIDEVIPYCFRPANNFNESFEDVVNPLSQKLSFEELRLANITSQQLLSWSIAIDVAERYQFYLNEPKFLLNEHVYNCTEPWFGLRCQYSFEFGESMFFNQIVKDEFLGRKPYSESSDIMVQMPCYIFLKCHRNGQFWCLDWREVCDGNVDCYDEGLDEESCFDMELNECKEDEYRCHNGLCISNDLWEEGKGDADCLDRSDEVLDASYIELCFQDPTFRCEEHSCRPNADKFPCGDGQCVPKFKTCPNGRHVLLIESMTAKGHLTNECWTAMVCLTKLVEQVNGTLCERWIMNNLAYEFLKQCDYFFQFPIIPIHSAHIRFFYENRHLKPTLKQFFIPDYICYDQQLCDSIIPQLVHENLTCLQNHTLLLELDRIQNGTYACVSPINYTVICLSAEQVNDGKEVDCLGAADEQQECRWEYPTREFSLWFRCSNNDVCLQSSKLCDNNLNCPLGDDEHFCNNLTIRCDKGSVHNRSEIEKVLCGLSEAENDRIEYFSVHTSSNYPSSEENIFDETIHWPIERHPLVNINASRVKDNLWAWYCNRGLIIHTLIENNSCDKTCMCPPSYYGHLCQYQNQRISLTLRLSSIDTHATYAFVIMLIDDNDEEQKIDAYDQFVYIAKQSYKFGFQCLLTSTCPINACQNNGKCIPADLTIPQSDYTCICPDRFLGRNCEKSKFRLDVSLDAIHIPSYLVAYFFTLSNKSEPIKTIILRKLSLFQYIVTFHIVIPFHIVIIKAIDKYYLAVLQQSPKTYISTLISSKQECIPIEQLFNSTVLTMVQYQRIVFYYDLCRRRFDLTCFIDEFYICLCTNDHHANCMEFNHDRNFQCILNNHCANGAQCLQDHPICPSTRICICANCFFGNKCQFYAKGLGSTLDEILGYEFKHNTILSKQSYRIKVSVVITMLIFVIDNWLNACVAIERTVSVFQGVYFNKNKSKQIAYYIIILLFVIIFCLSITQLVKLHVFEDKIEERSWCVVTYSSWIQTYSSIWTFFHYFAPLFINLLSALLIIIKTTHQRVGTQTSLSFLILLGLKLKKYKHLLISPVIILILTLPHFIISIILDCNKSSHLFWFYLIAYFLSFIPAAFIFIIFVIASPLYRQEFKKTQKFF
ncbi:unnamed protein product [Rotaria sordida]|uniref:Uncharacterized protein n=1 Tax=Rotaria sordida TaxID=392033 RepID=A0A819BES7_9BILA|nr:unnamed protein product [Rotaria sordida]